MTDYALYIGCFTLGTIFGMFLTAMFAAQDFEEKASKYEPPQNYQD